MSKPRVPTGKSQGGNQGQPEDKLENEGEIEQSKKRFHLLDAQRKAFYANAEDTKRRNNENIKNLRDENKELKRLRDELLAQKTSAPTMGGFAKTTSSGFNHPTDLRDENYWRKKFDEAKNNSDAKKRQLLTLQEKLNEISEAIYATQEDTPLTRHIRILENRLDKVMIKYNEALSIRKTYETIVKRLKEERVGYDNQLAAIEKSLKGKEHDFEELLLLAHDANHAKEMALAELRKYESKKEAVKELRRTYIDEKKRAIDSRENMIQKLANQDKEPSEHGEKDRQLSQSNAFHDSSMRNQEGGGLVDVGASKQKIMDYEEAFRRVNEATGVTDVNEIIQKFTTQDETSNALNDLKQEYIDKIEELTKERNETKSRLNELKYAGSENLTRKQLDEIENNVSNATNKYERAKAKYDRISNNLVNVKAGIEHLCEKLEFFKLEGKPNIIIGDDTIVEALAQGVDKLRLIYQLVKNDPVFAMEERKKQAKKETAMIYNNPNLSSTGGFVNINLIDRGTKIEGLEKNIRVKTGEKIDDDVSEGDIDDDIDIEMTTKLKAKYEMQLKQERAKQGKQKKQGGAPMQPASNALRAKSSGVGQ